jgi:hypothetical protein
LLLSSLLLLDVPMTHPERRMAVKLTRRARAVVLVLVAFALILNGADASAGSRPLRSNSVPTALAIPIAAGMFVPLAPARIADTRIGLAAGGPIGSGQILTVAVLGAGGIPSDGVAAVMANVTVTEPTAPGNVSVYPAGIPHPLVSNVNFDAGQTVPNLVIVPVGTDGSIALSNNSTGAIQVIVDVAGFYRAGIPNAPGAYQSLTPNRIADTRWNMGAVGPVTAELSIALQVAGVAGVPLYGVAAVVANVTVTEPNAPGNLSVYPLGIPKPLVSNLNFLAGQSVPNLVTVPVGVGGRIVLSNNSPGPTHVIVDLQGYYLAGYPTDPGAYVPVTPTRITDTRTSGAVEANRAMQIQVAGNGGVPVAGTEAVLANVTVTEPAAPGNISVYPSGTAPPATSSLNFTAGQTVPNLVGIGIGSDGKIELSNNSPGSSHVVLDIAGYFLGGQ